MRQSNGFESWRQLQLHFAGGHRAQQFSLLRTIMRPSWNSNTRQFTKQYYKWLEDINRYESENGQGTINDHVKIATVVNNLKARESRGNIAQNVMMRINQATTFDEVHQWISNYFNSAYTGTDEDNEGQVGGVSNYDDENYDNKGYYDEENERNWDYDNSDKVTIAFMNGKARGQRRGKGKGKKGDNAKGKDGKTITFYTCGRQGHTSTTCYHNIKGKSGKGQNKGYQPQSCYQQPSKGYPQQQQQPPYQPHYYNQPPQQPSSTPQQYNKDYSKGYGKPWNKGGKKGQVPMTMTTPTTTKRTHTLGTIPTVRNGSQGQTTLVYPRQSSGQEVDQQSQVLQQQHSGPMTMGSLYEIGSLSTSTIHIDRHTPRHLKHFGSISIDTRAAVSVCPLTFCEHTAVKTMPESARRQYVTVTGEGLAIEGWKEVTLVIGTITMQTRFIVANVQSALLGLLDIDENNVTIHTGKKPYIEKKGIIKQLHPHGAHLHANAMVLPGLHKPKEVKIDRAVNTLTLQSLQH
eukprot:3081731-Amphidinium_carterae.2